MLPTITLRGRGISIRSMRATRLKRSEDPQNTCNENDAAFYIGINAECWFKTRRGGMCQYRLKNYTIIPIE